MKPVPLDITRQGSLGGQVIPMTVDQKSLKKLMSVLTDLYSDPISAFIREYSTNARDAHIDAGKEDVPIEVTLPNSLSPYFKIRDFGRGMSIDFIENVYSQYGNSTKEETNDLVGYLGLGSKSGLTYCAQFRVISIHQGIKAQIMVSKNQDGASEMEVVDTSATDEADGVEVIIPIHNVYEVTERAQNFFRFWKKGTVLVDGKPPLFIGDDNEALWVDDDILVLPQSGTSYVVMGNVPYKVEGLVGPYAAYKAVAFVPVGSVSFPPSREELMYTEATKKTIRDFAIRTREGLERRIQEEIDKAETYLDALKTADNLGSMTGGTWTYNGEDLKTFWSFNRHGAPDVTQFYPASERHAVSHPSSIAWKEFRDYLTITGFTGEKVSTQIRQKIRKYIADFQRKPLKVFLVQDHPDLERLSEIKTVSLDTIKAIKLDPVKRGDGKMKKFNALNKFGYTTEKDSLDSTKSILYIVPGRRKIKWKEFSTLLDDFEIVSLYKSEVKKFLTLYSGAENLDDYVKDRWSIAKASLTKTDRLYMADINYSSKNLAAILDEAQIDDPNLVSFIKMVKMRTKRSEEIIEYYKAAGWVAALGQNVDHVDSGDVDDPFEKYPLVRYHYGNVEHVIIYLNAVYAYEKEKSN
jgi:hypothetical protein